MSKKVITSAFVTGTAVGTAVGTAAGTAAGLMSKKKNRQRVTRVAK